MAGARGGDRRRPRARTGLADRAPAALHRRHQRAARRRDRRALSGVRERPRRADDLSRAGPAGGLCDARPETARPGRAPLRGHAGGMDHPHAWPPSMCAASGARTASASGCAGRTRARASRTRSPPSASACTQWVTLHGMALNVDPDLSHFSGIVPCGVSEQRYGVTSLADLGRAACRCRRWTWCCGGNSRRCSARRADQAVGSTENNSPGRRSFEFVLAAVALIERIDARGERPAPAGLDHRRAHVVARTGEHRLDRAVAAIAHPAFEAALERLVLDEGAEADALHAAAHHDVADDPRLFAHASSPASRMRAPVQREVLKRSTDRI